MIEQLAMDTIRMEVLKIKKGELKGSRLFQFKKNNTFKHFISISKQSICMNSFEKQTYIITKNILINILTIP